MHCSRGCRWGRRPSSEQECPVVEWVCYRSRKDHTPHGLRRSSRPASSAQAGAPPAHPGAVTCSSTANRELMPVQEDAFPLPFQASRSIPCSLIHLELGRHAFRPFFFLLANKLLEMSLCRDAG